MGTTTIHPAESYLRNETNPSSLYVRIAGKRRRLFINRDRGIIGIIVLGKRIKGYVFTDWSSIEQIYYPSQEQEANTDRKLILKYQKLARLATHTNYAHGREGTGQTDQPGVCSILQARKWNRLIGSESIPICHISCHSSMRVTRPFSRCWRPTTRWHCCSLRFKPL